MNKTILSGRLVKDAEVRYNGDMAVGNYTLAVDRVKEGTDFIRCVCFGKSAEFAEKYLKKGTKIIVEGRIQTGSYEKDGQKFYTTDVVVERTEFAESKKAQEEAPKSEGWDPLPTDIGDEIPFA